MPKFMLVYRSKPYTAAEIAPEAMQQAMEQWNSWIGQGFAQGWMVDPGDALLPTGKVMHKTLKVTDGPFAEAKEIVGGYSIVQCDNIEAALEKAKTCPALQDESDTIEVRELAGLAGK